jgi:hypothetical protein
MKTNALIVIKGMFIGMFIMLILCLISCSSTKNSCHGDGRKYYVDKSVRKAQSRVSAYRY